MRLQMISKKPSDESASDPKCKYSAGISCYMPRTVDFSKFSNVLGAMFTGFPLFFVFEFFPLAGFDVGFVFGGAVLFPKCFLNYRHSWSEQRLELSAWRPE